MKLYTCIPCAPFPTGAPSPRSVRTAGIVALVLALAATASPVARSQTPSPLQEWQFSSGVVLQKLFEPTVPEWQVILGAAVQTSPLYAGAQRNRVLGGPVINIRYSDLAFLSTGEGLGVNLLQGRNYRAGVAIGYDLGRKVADDEAHLHGLGDLSPAPALKLFASYAISKSVPVVLRANVRQILGGADGLVADLAVYMPLPGSSKTLIMFAGPSLTVMDQAYAQHLFGVTPAQAMSSQYQAYRPHGGLNALGFGFSATRFVSTHWLVNAEAAVNRLLRSAQNSPITQSAVQGVLVLSTAYRW